MRRRTGATTLRSPRPGADIFLPAPDEKYQIASGTSFSAAYVSGVAALMLERNPALKPPDVRAILTKTARDLGAPGRDDQFGAGEADAFAAVTAAAAAPAVPLASVSGQPAGEKTPALDPSADNASVSRALNDSPPSMAAEKSQQTLRNSLLRGHFPAIASKHRVKKIASRFQRPARVLRLMMWER